MTLTSKWEPAQLVSPREREPWRGDGSTHWRSLLPFLVLDLCKGSRCHQLWGVSSASLSLRGTLMRVACHRFQTYGACTFASRSLHTCRFRAWSFRTESWIEMASCSQKMVTIIEGSPAPDTRAKVKFVTAGHPETWGGCSFAELQLVYSRIRRQEVKLNVDLKCVLPVLFLHE